MSDMSENPGSKDKALEALDFIINVLKEHEQSLDKSIDELATVTEQIGDTGALKSKVEKFEEKIDKLQNEVTNLIGCLTNPPKETLPVAVEKQEPQAQAKPAVSPALVQSGSSMIFQCKQWMDFQVLAMHAQMLSFSIKEDEKIFQVEAFKGMQIIRYTGAFPNFSIIFKIWLSRQLNITERNILEGFLAKPK
jgi:hypothetical protein